MSRAVVRAGAQHDVVNRLEPLINEIVCRQKPSFQSMCATFKSGTFIKFVHPISCNLDLFSAWARRETENYKDISVVDLKDSWGDGKAFCAIIHKYCPELM